MRFICSKLVTSVAIATITLTTVNTANAGVILNGNDISIGINDDGTLNRFKYDKSGTGTFGSSDQDDWILPGTPFEGFSFKSLETGLISNVNNDSTAISGTTVDTSAMSMYDLAATTTGTFGTSFNFSSTASFDMNSTTLFFNMTIEALTDLTDFEFARMFDPDWFTSSCGEFNTTNNRVNSDFVTATGCDGTSIGIYSDSTVSHNVGYNSDWSRDTSGWNSGVELGGAYNDSAIGIGFDLGTIGIGDTFELSYSYVMAPTIDSLEPPTDIPEPSTLAIFLLGLLGLSQKRKLKS